MNNGGRMTFLHDQTLFGLSAVVRCTKVAMWIISGWETTYQNSEVPVCFLNTIYSSCQVLQECNGYAKPKLRLHQH